MRATASGNGESRADLDRGSEWVLSILDQFLEMSSSIRVRRPDGNGYLSVSLHGSVKDAWRGLVLKGNHEFTSRTPCRQLRAGPFSEGSLC
jgi:hypothetical protein